MRVLVTGGAGSIGVFVVKKLLERGDEVVIVDNFNDFYDPELKRFRLKKILEGLSEPKVYENDICESERIEEIFAKEKPEKVIHLAAWAAVRPSIAHPLLYTRANVDGTVAILEASRKFEVKNVVFASSSSVYGRNSFAPYKESANCDFPIAPYAASKRAGELYASMYHYLYKMPVICLRFFTVYGPWIRPDMATWRFAEQIANKKEIVLHRFAEDGAEVKRDFTYVDDIVSGIVTALDRNHGFDVVNLGNNDPVSLTRFVIAIEAEMGMKAKINEKILPSGEAVVTGADLTRAKDVLNYQPATSVEEGIKKFCDWYKGEFVKIFPRGLARSKYY